jgi:hypothetical protein
MLVSDSETVVCKSSDPQNIFCYTPSIVITITGKLIATIDLGGEGVEDVHGEKFPKDRNNAHFGQGKILESTDNGSTWKFVKNFPFWHARLFVIKRSVYIIGHANDICIIRSDDDGATWSELVKLTVNEKWHSSACNVIISRNHVYLAMEKRFYIDEIKGWNVAGLSPILLRANINEDLCNSLSWTMSDPIIYRDVIKKENLQYLGIPFYECEDNSPTKIENRNNAPIGWLEANVVQFRDPKHIWYDNKQKTFHLFLRSHTAGVGYANVIKVVEQNNGLLKAELEKVPSGKEILFLPFPGGHLKFYILFDDVSKYYWLLSNQSTDSMLKPSLLDNTHRFGLPNNERHRLQLLFSRNCIDWCFAGMIASSDQELFSRNYPSAVINGNDLHVICRSADQDTLDPQYSDLITHHIVKDFRRLIY